MTKKRLEQRARKSRAMKLSWERRREKQAMEQKLQEAKAAELAAKYNSPAMNDRPAIEPNEEMPVWRTDNPNEQIRLMNLEIQMLKNKLDRFRAYKRVTHEAWSSVAAMLSIIEASESFTREHD